MIRPTSRFLQAAAGDDGQALVEYSPIPRSVAIPDLDFDGGDVSGLFSAVSAGMP